MVEQSHSMAQFEIKTNDIETMILSTYPLHPMNKKIHPPILLQREIQKQQPMVVVERQSPSHRGWRRVLGANLSRRIHPAGTLGAAPESKTRELENELCISSGPVSAASVDVQGELLLRSGRSLLGLQVVTEGTGFPLGLVRDLMFNSQTEQIVALVLGVKEFFGMKSFQIVPWNQIVGIDEEAITVKNANSQVKLSDYPPTSFLKINHETIEHETMLAGTEILDSEGRLLGTFADLYIDEASGRVEGLEVSGEFVALSLQGMKTNGMKLRGKRMPPISQSVSDTRPDAVASNAKSRLSTANASSNTNFNLNIDLNNKEPFRAS